ncbi:hypothetical protein K2173_023871 [Erythroxylum novogranatense]|uniref:Probable ubiquitin-like-specific protease 2A/B PH domain-containing protein n=1 Tax=Erythroxylum novogranatense TaxID=1862640 RepID=A0AAV8TPP9_9ROSI|nr:hypothetical protein K2173_023871 [Erythroxylum novogranatense]
MKRQPCAVTSPKNRFSVFEFGEEDERVERTSGNLLGRLGQSRRRKHSRSSPSTKYKSLACLTGTLKEKNRKGTVDVGNAPVEINIDGGSKFQSDSICNKLVDIDGDSRGNGIIHPTRSLIKSSPFEEDAVGVGISQADTLVLSNSSYFKSEQVGKISEDDGQIKLNLLTSVSTALVNKVNSQQKVVKHGSLRLELDPLIKEVFIFPDFFLFGDLYCTESRLIFSESCIRVEASTVNGTKGKFNARWPIIDIIKVESQWCRRVETAIVNLHLKSKVSQGVGYENETSAPALCLLILFVNSGVILLHLAVWKQCQIMP